LGRLLTPGQFHQVVRASAPLFTIFLSAVLLGKHSSRTKLISLIPIIAGVGFAYVGPLSHPLFPRTNTHTTYRTYGDYYFIP